MILQAFILRCFKSIIKYNLAKLLFLHIIKHNIYGRTDYEKVFRFNRSRNIMLRLWNIGCKLSSANNTCVFSSTVTYNCRISCVEITKNILVEYNTIQNSFKFMGREWRNTMKIVLYNPPKFIKAVLRLFIREKR